MAIQKGFWLAFGISILILVAAVVLLLQPSGQVSDFQKWQYKASAQVATYSKIKVKFFGISTLLSNDGKTQVLIDGFFSHPSIGQVRFTKIQSQSQILKQVIAQYQLQRTQAILVTHSHYDHALDIAELGKQLPNSKIIGSNSSLNIARGGHVPEQQLLPVQPFKPMLFGQFKVTAIPSQHTPPTAVNNDLGDEITQPRNFLPASRHLRKAIILTI